MTGNKHPHIVVLGAGFGGLEFCKRFEDQNARITLVDRTNHHLFQPLLYQVATAGLSAVNVQPIRSVLGGPAEHHRAEADVLPLDSARAVASVGFSGWGGAPQARGWARGVTRAWEPEGFGLILSSSG